VAESAAGEVGVVHLVRCANDLAPLQRFLDSYDAHPAGLAHELLFVLKGFSANPRARAAVVDLIGSRSRGFVEVPDRGLDLDAYGAAAQAFDQAHLLFLNSFSVLAAAGWLAKMHAAAGRPGVGIVGATASCESLFTDEIDLLRRALRARFAGDAGGAAVASGAETDQASVPGRRTERGLRRLWAVYRDYRAFPNPHVRTNAFMLPREVIGQLEWPATPAKEEAYRLESGRRSLTAQVLDLGLEPLVVGRDGRTFPVAEWSRSGTFWQQAQENLLVEDNQTREYQVASATERRTLAHRAWRGRA